MACNMLQSSVDALSSCRLHGTGLPVVHRIRSNPSVGRRSHCIATQQHKPHHSHVNPSGSLPLVVGSAVAHQVACIGAACAVEAVGDLAEASATLPLALGGGVAIAALSAALIATDPQKR